MPRSCLGNAASCSGGGEWGAPRRRSGLFAVGCGGGRRAGGRRLAVGVRTTGVCTLHPRRGIIFTRASGEPTRISTERRSGGHYRRRPTKIPVVVINNRRRRRPRTIFIPVNCYFPFSRPTNTPHVFRERTPVNDVVVREIKIVLFFFSPSETQNCPVRGGRRSAHESWRLDSNSKSRDAVPPPPHYAETIFVRRFWSAPDERTTTTFLFGLIVPRETDLRRSFLFFFFFPILLRQ